METLPVVLRAAGKADIPFITSSWLKSYRDSAAVKGVPNTIYYASHHRVLEHLIPRSTVLVAANPDATEQILGWICAELVNGAFVLHFLYVKNVFRRFGLAQKLVASLEEVEKPVAHFFTHRTRSMTRWEQGRRWIYNPYYVWKTLPEGWDSD